MGSERDRSLWAHRRIISPFLEGRDSETWHVRAREALHFAESNPFLLRILERFAYGGRRYFNDRLKVVVGGVALDNPVMVGAGWDKNVRAVRGLFQLGFSGVEVGTVLQYPQDGNPRPRQFMLGPGVALNRLGFNSPGMEVVAANLQRYANDDVVIGVSVGINKGTSPYHAPYAHAAVVRNLYPHADYFAINVSSPNTPGLRELQDKDKLTDIVQAVTDEMEVIGGYIPTFIKIAPDLTDYAVDDVIRVVVDHGLSGIIACNTTIRPDIKARYGSGWADQPGGLSGSDPTYRAMVNSKISHIYRETAGQLDVIGVGGVNGPDAALDKILAGSRTVQIVTGIREVGTGLPGWINESLVEFMDREGVQEISELVGAGV